MTYRLMSGFAAEMPDEPGLAASTALPKVVVPTVLGGPHAATEQRFADAEDA